MKRLSSLRCPRAALVAPRTLLSVHSLMFRIPKFATLAIWRAEPSRLPRVRFTIQRMMVAVATIAIIGGMLYRSYQHRRTAEHHRIAAEKAAVAQKVAIWKATIDERFNDKSDAMRHSSLAEWIGRLGSFHSRFVGSTLKLPHTLAVPRA